ncbi:MAG: hypothetical protein Q8L15_06650 [Methylobacter sp.]|nr:hypothetical protein [Methylobacter sp.]
MNAGDRATEGTVAEIEQYIVRLPSISGSVSSWTVGSSFSSVQCRREKKLHPPE